MKKKLLYVLLLFTTVSNVRAAAKEKLLLDAGVGADFERVRQGRSLLMRAAESGDKDVVEKLLDLGITLNVVDRSGRSPLIKAVIGGHKGMVEFLLKRGATVDDGGFSGKTALIEAAQKGYQDIVELLLAYDANTKIQDRTGKTAADYARERKDDDLAVHIDNYVYDKGLTKSAAKKNEG